MKRRFLTVLSVLLLASLIVTSLTSCSLLSGILGGSNVQDGSSVKTESEEKAEEAVSFVCLNINPLITITLDKENKVVSVLGGNDDAVVLLYELALVGVDIDTAVWIILDAAKTLGYIGEDNKVIGASAYAPTTDESQNIMDMISVAVRDSAERLEMDLEVDIDPTYSAEREMEALKAKYPENEKIQSMTLAEYYLITAVVRDSALTVEEAVALDRSELIRKLALIQINSNVCSIEFYRRAKEEARRAHEMAMNQMLAGVYFTYYTKNAMFHPDTWYFGGVASMYASSIVALGYMADMLASIEDVSVFKLSDEMADPIIKALGLTRYDIDLIRDYDGWITLVSVRGYVDKVLKNLPENEEYVQKVADINKALDEVEANVAEAIAEQCADLIPSIQPLLTSSRAYAESLQIALDSQELKEYIDEYNAVVSVLETKMSMGSVCEADLRACITGLSANEQEVLEKIDADLTDRQKLKLEKERDNVREFFAESLRAMNEALDEGETQARERIEAELAERKSAGEEN